MRKERKMVVAQNAARTWRSPCRLVEFDRHPEILRLGFEDVKVEKGFRSREVLSRTDLPGKLDRNIIER